MSNENWNKYTLKLDAAWQPLQIIDSFKAFNMCLTGRAKLVLPYSDNMPSVIVLTKYVRRFNFSLTCNRRNVFWRDENQCQYCYEYFRHSELTMDHVYPKSLGGPKTWENIVTSCKTCNTKKKNKTPKQANMPLLRKPISPRVKMIDLHRNIIIEEDWEQFL